MPNSEAAEGPFLADRTWEDIRDRDPARCLAILPVGATEAHGPHLPLAADVVIAEAMATAGARILRERGQDALVLPSFAYTAAPFAADFPGTVSVAPETVSALLVDVARSLTGQGFRGLVLANSHLDPAHLGSLQAGVDRCAAEGLLPVHFPNLTRKPWALRMGDEFRTGACHAGRYETSVVLAARPDLVRDAVARALPANPASLSAAIGSGKTSFAEADGPRAYFGWPADATSAEGRELIDVLGGIVADCVNIAA
ncbi:MAG: creatinine amidohydrolase [Gemmatimonadota bacterium]|nr:MAG: creatinine amidohydrolase [Gemmatimonadota bacterium]